MELIKGEIYVITDKGYPNTKIIHLYEHMEKNGTNSVGYYISNMNDRKWCFKYSEPYIESRNIRLATYEERVWLNTCIKENKFVPFKDIIFNKIYELW